MVVQDVGYLLNKAARSLRLQFAARLAGTGLTTQQAAALMALERAGQPVAQTVLADAIGADLPTTSGLVNRLVRDHWVEVRPNPADGRSRVITPSKKACGVLPSVRAAAEEASSEAVACLDPPEVEMLSALLARICEADAVVSEKATER